MPKDAERYLDLISLHLQEHRAALFVGSGFSRNAAKITPSVKDLPLWNDLKQCFIEKLNLDHEGVVEMERESPLTLAEQVEIAYGRPELDRLLSDAIRDDDYRPAQPNLKLLQLPWSDIFTTNYDRLLERASYELTEQRFSVILNKNDLLGSAGSTRIIKLHGSFPSQRPFIITSEDYRTYPQRFAPFVNTVQQSLLENTLCMIGFSGDDPNFNSWVGWMRDNLGENNMPRMYLLLHRAPSEARREWLRRKNVIAVDLSEMFPDKQPSAIYENALDYLLKQWRESNEIGVKWAFKIPEQRLPKSTTIEQALPTLKANHKNCPNLLTLPGERLSYLRNIVQSFSLILSDHCKQEKSDPTYEINYLYEYDWLRTKALLPLFTPDIKNYKKILARHSNEYNEVIISIRLSMLRTFRECGAWDEWDAAHKEICSAQSVLTSQQLHQLKWEECLFSFYRYEFQKLKQQLNDWMVPDDMPLWALRKASLLAEYGECVSARELLQNAILNIRRRLSHQSKPDLYDLSLESAMMSLQGFIAQALSSRFISDDSPKVDPSDARHLTLHKKYHVSWEEQNAYYVSQLEAKWEPFHNHRSESTFDFGGTRANTYWGEDKDRMLAFSFLRFREETGMPFFVRSVHSNKKAACGAAERIAQYMPLWAIHLIVRSDEPKSVDKAITRGVLCSWSQSEADSVCRFYLDAIHRTESELSAEDWFYRNSFARLAADVLPELLSELCCKCSVFMLNELLNLLEQLYASPKKLCYQQTGSLAKRLIQSFPGSDQGQLSLRLARFPLVEVEDSRASHYFPDPLEFVPFTSERCENATDITKEMESLLDSCPHHKAGHTIINHLLLCYYHGLLNEQQKMKLGNLLWSEGKLCLPGGWFQTVCLDFPSPEGVDVKKALSDILTEKLCGRCDGELHIPSDKTDLQEAIKFALADRDAFSPEQISRILFVMKSRMSSLSKHTSSGYDFDGINNSSMTLLYNSAKMLWLLTARKSSWNPTVEDKAAMESIMNICEHTGVNHHGLKSMWSRILCRPFSAKDNLGKCLRSTDMECIFQGYDMIALAVQYDKPTLLDTTELREGIAIMAQHIVWGVPKGLAYALQTARTVAEHQAELLKDVSEMILLGLEQLLPQTVITEDDTISSASEKGNIRREAAALASTLMKIHFIETQSEILDAWQTVMQDPNEFSEIRNASRT